MTMCLFDHLLYRCDQLSRCSASRLHIKINNDLTLTYSMRLSFDTWKCLDEYSKALYDNNNCLMDSFQACIKLKVPKLQNALLVRLFPRSGLTAGEFP